MSQREQYMKQKLYEEAFTRKRLVSEPLEYIFSQEDVKLEDFEVSKFTRAGELVQLLLESIPEKFTICCYIQLIIRKYKVFG